MTPQREHELPVPYADTSAEQLGYALDAPEQTPLATCDGEFGGITISLRLLGASHQVIVDDGSRRLCETVACLPEVTSALPESFQDSTYYFGSRLETLTRDAMETLVGELVELVAAHQAAGLPAVIGHFPGEPHAVTAIVADADDAALNWRTWHTYPQVGEVVVTSSVLQRAGVRST